MSDVTSILVVRLGAMGDIVHALPAVASLRQSFPKAQISWVVASKWRALLEGNPQINRIIAFDRRNRSALFETWRTLHSLRPDLAIDFQGLIQSALAGRAARPARLFGLDRSQARESLAALFYTQAVKVAGPHCVEFNLELVSAAGATDLTGQAWLPQGEPEGDLPSGPFIFTAPFAGWTSKQWPLENYSRLAHELRTENLPLVVNVPPGSRAKLATMPELIVHESGLPGLIDATRRAAAVIGVDSGPLHLAAAVGKPGVAIFGPTDPARNGPFHSKFAVLRAPNAITTYKRNESIDPSMSAVTVAQVKEALLESLRRHSQ